MKIVCINGFPCSGKDTFCDYLEENEEFTNFHKINTFSLSTVDFVKQVAEYASWDGAKTPKNRKFLSDLKDLLTEWNDIPIKDIKHKIRLYENLYDKTENIFFIHTREPEELQRLKEEWGAKTLLIRRPLIENNEQSNHADADVLNFDYDYVIYNDGTIENLQKKAESFIINILNEEWESKLK